MIAAVAVMIAGELVLPLYLIISISIPTSSSVSISISIPTFNSTLFRRHCGELATDAIIRGWHNVRLRPRAAATEAKGRRDCGAATAISRHPRPELAVNRYCDQFRDCFALPLSKSGSALELLVGRAHRHGFIRASRDCGQW